MSRSDCKTAHRWRNAVLQGSPLSTQHRETVLRGVHVKTKKVNQALWVGSHFNTVQQVHFIRAAKRPLVGPLEKSMPCGGEGPVKDCSAPPQAAQIMDATWELSTHQPVKRHCCLQTLNLA